MAANEKMLGLLLAGPKKQDDAPAEDAEAAPMADADLTTAAGDVRAALEGGDDEGLASALKAFVSLCGMGEG